MFVQTTAKYTNGHERLYLFATANAFTLINYFKTFTKITLRNVLINIKDKKR